MIRRRFLVNAKMHLTAELIATTISDICWAKYGCERRCKTSSLYNIKDLG